ncbi:NUDIX domain-containing protein [Candidatus Saccharibacteria bacterium]|nr:NUDIX domain-containing protein [Candidatus Saccharibacteria bacterium]
MNAIRARDTARGIVVRDGNILLIERFRGELHYFSIPGGGIEPGETPAQTALREIAEETSLNVSLVRQVLIMRDGPRTHYIYLCTYVSGEPYLPPDAPEAQIYDPYNRFEPCWLPISALDSSPFVYWEPLRAAIINGLAKGFAAEPLVVSASTSR